METIVAELSCNANIECELSANDVIVAELYLPSVKTDTDISVYMGEYTVTPKPNEKQVLNTTNKMLVDDITVKEIPYYEVSNAVGHTVYIGKEIVINGN